jgi:hypothetical protein
LICNSLMSNIVEHFFMYLLSICTFKKCLSSPVIIWIIYTWEFNF